MCLTSVCSAACVPCFVRPPSLTTHQPTPQEAQQQLLQEKQQSQQLAGSLLEHAGRLSHKYFNLSDDYDALEHRCVIVCVL